MKIDDLEVFKAILTASLYDESAWRLVEGPMVSKLKMAELPKFLTDQLKRKVVKALRKRGLVLMRPAPYDSELRRSGLDWPFFGYTMVGQKRLDNIHQCVEAILKDNIRGDFIETGVWRGGAVMLMKAILDHHGVHDRNIWCADSFEGLPPPNETDLNIDSNSDFSDRDFLSVSKEQVIANFNRFGLLNDQIKFLKGWFCDTLPNAPIEELSLIRLDGDLYESTMDSLNSLYPKLTQGGFLIIDDYASWAGCRRAVDEYREQHSITEPMIKIDEHAYYWRSETSLNQTHS